ncbi:Golgin subfamily A member 7/ERF4 family-domain-containing protein [Mycena rebaudengoi]|nr:Golgin subfamily A member 7/ERF4 family-domain-containing protein [Mycena rebaudengoi]
MTSALPSPQGTSHDISPPSSATGPHAVVNTPAGHSSPTNPQPDLAAGTDSTILGDNVLPTGAGYTDGPEQGGVAKAGVETKEVANVVAESSIWPNALPPSPPLTRPNTGDSSHKPVRHAADEKDIAGNWEDPLRSPDKDHSGDIDETHDTTVVEKDIVDAGGVLNAETEESAKPVRRQASQIVLGIKAEPQPWDLVDPPETNGQTNAEYYATLKSQNYTTLRSSCVRARVAIPKSSYYFGPPPADSAYGTHPVGQIGLHHPREILRVERDYTGGELVQFAPIYPLELEGRITPTQFLESINAINELLISAHSLRYSFLDNFLSVFTLQLSRLLTTSHYEKEMHRLEQLIDELNAAVYNPVGLNILWPRRVAFLFMEIEYY